MNKLIFLIILLLIIISGTTINAQTAAYVTTPSEPWYRTGNIDALNTIYGTEGVDWKKFLYSSASVNEIFTSERKLVFIEGGDRNTSKMIALLNSDWTAIESWISNGGSLIVNAATNEVYTKFEIGSSGIYSEHILTNKMQAYVDSEAYPEPPYVHPLLTDAKYPAYYNGDYYGNYVAHNVITGDYTSSVFSCTNGNTLVEKLYGSGRLIVGGLTMPFFISASGWQPQPQMSNFLYSMLSWAKELNKGFKSFNGSTLSEDVLENDTDQFGNKLYITVVPYLEHGTFLSFNLETGEFVYEAPTDWAGKFNFSCTISNGIETYDIIITITVLDVIPPVVATQNKTLQLNEAGNAFLTPEEVDNGSYDNIGITELSLDKTNFSCSDVGTASVTLTATDAAGNTTNGTAYVTVEDNVAPQVATQDITVQLDENGSAIIAPADIDNGSYDACGIASLELSQTVFDCSHVGDNQVTLTVTDNNGNESTATAVITVEDNVAPVALTKNVTVQLDDAGSGSVTAKQVDNGSNDACGIASLELSQTVFDCSHVGTNQVTLTVTDNHGNKSTATADVTVEDNVVPTVVIKDIIIELDATGNALATAADVDNASSDNCGIATMNLSKTSFNCGDLGDNTVELIITDVNGNSNSSVAVITVVDKVAPVVNIRPLTIYLRHDGTYTLSKNNIETITKAGEEVATIDNCSAYTDLEISISQSSFSCEEAGTRVPVTLTVTDASGNTSAEETTIWVIDPYAPDVMCRDTTIYLGVKRTAHLSVTDLDAGTTDACGIENMWLDTYSFNDSDLGENPVTFFAKDVHGNWSSCVSTVTVVDSLANSAPVVVNPISDQWVAVHQVLTIPVDGYEIFSDMDGDELTIEVSPENENLNLSWFEYINDTIYISPVEGDDGCENLIVRATDASGNFATHTFSVCIESGLVNADLTDAKTIEVKVYPNPANEKVTVELLPAGIYDVTLNLTNINGQLILLQEYYPGERINVDVSDIVPGLYLIKLDFEDRQIIKKLIIDHK